MWKLKNFFRVVSLLCVGISVTKAYDVTCQFDGNIPPACYEFTLTPITQPNELANFIGQPANYIDNRPRMLGFDETFVLNYIPTDMFNHMTNIRHFNTQNASISTIVSNAFVNCQNLIYITMSYELFTHLPASFAEQCFNVNHIKIDFSNLQTIDENAFKSLIGLRSIVFPNNQIECLPPLLFQRTTMLMQIELPNNKIKALHPIIFKSLVLPVAFYSFNLMMNQITYIPDLELDISSWDQVSFNLALQDNPINAIHPLFLTHLFSNQNIGSNQIEISFGPGTLSIATCADLPIFPDLNLHKIVGLETWPQLNTAYATNTSCYSNFSPQMADNSLVTCGTIQTTSTTTSSTNAPTNPGSCSTDKICRYYLDYLNRYTCVLDGVEGVVSSISGTHYLTFTDANVERVYFANTQLSRIPNVLFTKFPNLNFLYVRNVGLGVINDHTFNQCGNLKYLDASYNDIIHIDETSLKNCTKLETIDLTGNPLDYVSTQLYVYDPSLKTVHFHRNADFTLN